MSDGFIYEKWERVKREMPLKKNDMNFINGVFGLKLLGDGQIGFYIEDDENYFIKCTFHCDWLSALEEIAHVANEFRKLENK